MLSVWDLRWDVSVDILWKCNGARRQVSKSEFPDLVNNCAHPRTWASAIAGVRLSNFGSRHGICQADIWLFLSALARRL